jgi:hypothetical protein
MHNVIGNDVDILYWEYGMMEGGDARRTPSNDFNQKRNQYASARCARARCLLLA